MHLSSICRITVFAKLIANPTAVFRVPFQSAEFVKRLVRTMGCISRWSCWGAALVVLASYPNLRLGELLGNRCLLRLGLKTRTTIRYQVIIAGSIPPPTGVDLDRENIRHNRPKRYRPLVLQ